VTGKIASMDLTTAIAQGAPHPVLLAGTALLLGALHGLEPGHSKTMMAAFIIAVHGTVRQAVVLGLSAAVSHTLIVWILAILALRFGDAMIGEALEPWFMMASGLIILAIAAWMVTRTQRATEHPGPAQDHHHHDHAHEHHTHEHHTHGHHTHGHHPSHSHHDHAHAGDPSPGDAHARAHAAEIERRFGAAGASGTTMTQTVLFGLTGGLIPCSAAITVLLLCLSLDRFWLGIGLVGAFSTGLALTLVTAGVIAALAVHTVARRTDRFDRLLARAPYVSAALIAVIGLGMIGFGWAHLPIAP